MTYCVGVLVREGLVMIADTRTNAGIDNISVYKKLHPIADEDDRIVFAATAGSLSVTQSARSHLAEGLPAIDDSGVPRLVAGQPTMFRVAQLAGEAVAMARGTIGAALAGTRISANASMLVGGRIGDQPLALFQIYAEGNFIECQPDAPFLQIGEVKYGKPILDRALTYETTLDEAVKVALISFDSTIRSNLSVGLPFDLIVIPSDCEKAPIRLRIEESDAYFSALSREWGRLLNEARSEIPDPPFMMPSPKRKRV
ncbi:MAG: peptidase [Sphingomonadales bacterium]